MGQLIFKFLHKFKLLGFLNLKSSVTLNNRKFIIPMLGTVGYANLFVTERWMINLLQNILPLKKGNFIDVGVNIGPTLLKLRSVDADRPYFGFEPNPHCVHYSSKLIELNQFPNTTLFPFGVSNSTGVGELNFYNKGESDASASMISDFRPEETVKKTIFIPLYENNTFSSLLGEQAIAFVKIDVEGAELEVIKSFESIIKKHKPIILIEILPVYTADNVDRLTRQEKMEAIFNSCEYSIFKLLKTREKVNGVEFMESIGIHEDMTNCDYVCVPQSMKEEFSKIQFN